MEFDGEVLGRFGACADLEHGARFDLGPGAFLTAWWIESSESFRVELNGLAVRGGSEVHPDIADAAPMVFGIGGFNLVAGQLAVIFHGVASLDVVVGGALLLVLGAFVRQGSRRALALAIGVLAITLIVKIALMFGDGPKLVPLITVIVHIALASAMVRSYVLATTEW